MSRLKWRSVKTLKTPGSAGGPEKSSEVEEHVKAPEVTLTAQQQLLASTLTPPSGHEAPLIGLSPLTSLQISEEQNTSTSSSWNTLYRGYTGTTAHPNDVRLLEHVLPYWAMECILKNQIPAYTAPKISFSLVPWTHAGQQPQDSTDANSHSSRLTASRFLRSRKVSAYIHDKIAAKAAASPRPSRPTSPSSSQISLPGTSSSRHHRAHTPSPRSHTHPHLPEEIYEILCDEAVVPWYMTLAAVRQYIWRQNGELVLSYRRRTPSSVVI